MAPGRARDEFKEPQVAVRTTAHWVRITAWLDPNLASLPFS
jgi:hypothetical protein